MGGLKAAVMTPDTFADESRKMAHSVTRFPARFGSTARTLCYYGRLEYDFLALAFVPSFLRFLFSPSFYWYVYLLRVLAICILPELGIIFYNCFVFPGSCYYPGGVFIVLSYPALDMPTLII